MLAGSALLNAAYFLPPIVAMWFGTGSDETQESRDRDHGAGGNAYGNADSNADGNSPSNQSGDAEHQTPAERGTGLFEAPGALLWSAVATAALSVLAGLLAAAPYSPLRFAQDIAERVFS